MSATSRQSYCAPSDRIVLAIRIMRIFWPGAPAAARSPLIFFPLQTPLFWPLHFSQESSTIWQHNQASNNAVLLSQEPPIKCGWDCSCPVRPKAEGSAFHPDGGHSGLWKGRQTNDFTAECGLRTWCGTESRSHTCILIWVLIGNKRQWHQICSWLYNDIGSQVVCECSVAF